MSLLLLVAGQVRGRVQLAGATCKDGAVQSRQQPLRSPTASTGVALCIGRARHDIAAQAAATRGRLQLSIIT